MKTTAVVRIAATLAVTVAAAACGGGTTHTATETPSRPATVAPGQPPTRAPSGPDVGVVLDASGALVARLTGNGLIAAAAADGRGGWFVAGAFTQLDGQPEQGLAHVLAGGTLDRGWHGSLSSSGRSALAVSGGALYAAGSIGDTDRSRLLVIDAATGTLRGRVSAPTGPISALAAEGFRLYVSTSTSTDPRRPSCLEAIDTRGARAAAGFSVDIRVSPELGCIAAMRLSGGWLYLAGSFPAVDGVGRPGVARVSASTGKLDGSWNPPANRLPGTTFDLAVGPGAVLLADSRPALRAVSVSTGAPERGWHSPSGIENVLSLAIDGGRLFVAGDFSGGLAVLRLPDGVPVASWRPAPGQAAGLASASGLAVLIALRHR